MIYSCMKTDKFYEDFFSMIVNLMKENGVTKIEMKDTIFGKKACWNYIFINENNKLSYSSMICGEEVKIEFTNHFSLHRMDMPALLECIILRMNDVYCVKEI